MVALYRVTPAIVIGRGVRDVIIAGNVTTDPIHAGMTTKSDVTDAM